MRDRAEIARTDLHEYIRQAWHLVEPATPFLDNWHIGAIAEHLQAVSRGEIRNLLINIPPRHAKSLEVSVFWPTWEWINAPWLRWIFASYAQKLSTRDSLKCRRIIESNWYQQRWGAVYEITSDQNEKTRFENSRTGYRIATSVEGIATGEGGDRIVVDDPHNVLEAESDTVRESVLTWWDEAMASRLNDPKTGARVIVMQRVHEKDLSGHVLAQGGYEHLCLPAEYEPKRRCITVLGWEDPRTEPGELLWPERFGQAELSDLKLRLGSYAAAGQLQQRPAPAEGGVIKRHWFRRFDIRNRPPSFDQIILSADPKFKDYETTSRVAVHIWGRIGPDKYLLARDIGHWGITESLAAIGRQRTDWHRPGDGVTLDAYLIEDKANGPAIMEVLRKKVAGIIAIQPRGSKEARVLAVSPQMEAGNIWIPETPWGDEVIDALCFVPNGDNWDDVDACSQALDYFGRTDDVKPEELVVVGGDIESAGHHWQAAN